MVITSTLSSVSFLLFSILSHVFLVSDVDWVFYLFINAAFQWWFISPLSLLRAFEESYCRFHPDVIIPDCNFPLYFDDISTRSTVFTTTVTVFETFSIHKDDPPNVLAFQFFELLSVASVFHPTSTTPLIVLPVYSLLLGQLPLIFPTYSLQWSLQ